MFGIIFIMKKTESEISFRKVTKLKCYECLYNVITPELQFSFSTQFENYPPLQKRSSFADSRYLSVNSTTIIFLQDVRQK